ncbi:MAG: UDP-N-acetylmuramoyl-L-alanyl-D-glutamate--2,6-diaminopimelate ligase [Lachnospiraceae bacterium]|nr:UDP-N-acetylmuramoyl-L-alanyl-D-glutamate--2,6-diaminopimelate ligase [Lachnospiraceae bacterium]
MKIKELLRDVDYQVLQGDVENEMTTLVYDSRKAEEGCAFVCITGAVSDGHKYVPSVLEKNPAVIIAEHPVEAPEDVCVVVTDNNRRALALASAEYFGHPADRLKTIGITGTKGKTTTTYMIKSMLEGNGHKVGLIGTIEKVIGDQHTPALNTTPESYAIHEAFAEMVDEGCDSVVMEVSSQALMLDRTAGITFDIGVFTNLAPDHIGEHEHSSFEDYRACKAMLFKQCRTGIGNIDDPNFGEIFKDATCRVITFGLSEKADLRASNEELVYRDDYLGIRYDLSGLINMTVDVDMPGDFSVFNSMAAIAVGLQFGATEDVIRKTMGSLHVRGRVQSVPTGRDCTILVDYAHNAMALESLLTTLRKYDPKRLVCIFGCGGNRDRSRRFEMGEVSGRLADLSIVTSDNPRFEEPEAIIEDIKTGIDPTGGEYVTIIDRGEAVRYALENAETGDVIVLAGKGHEDYQEIRGVKHHMDEVELVENARKELGLI